MSDDDVANMMRRKSSFGFHPQNLGLGFDPDESSDFGSSIVEDIELQDKKDLLRWRFKDGGDRLPRFFPKIPHIDETQVPIHILREESETLELCEKIAREARQAQNEFIYAKQQADVLQQEIDLLKWHISNNTKALGIKRNESLSLDQKNGSLKTILQKLVDEGDILERAQETLVKAADKLDASLEDAHADLEERQEEMSKWLARRGDYIKDAGLERRRANHERGLRNRQWKKLNQSCNVDKKFHVKLDAIKRRDEIVYDMSRDATSFLQKRYEAAGEIIGAAREAFSDESTQPTAEDLLSDFVSSAKVKAEALESVGSVGGDDGA